MEFDYYFLFLLSGLGVFNGLLVSLYFLFFKSSRKASDMWFGLLILMLTIRIGKSVLYYFNDDLPKWVLQFGLTACLFIGPFLYFYIKDTYASEDRDSLSYRNQLILLTLLAGIGLFITYESNPWFWNHIAIKVIYTVWVGYGIAAVHTASKLWLYKIWKKEKMENVEQWLTALLIANVVICLIFHSILYLSFPSYIFGPISFSFLFYFLVGFLLFSPWKNSILGQETPRPKSTKRELNPSLVNKLNRSLEQIMEEEKVFLQPDLKLDKLADTMDTTPHLLSQFLNDHVGKNFNTYINDRRVEAAAIILQSDHQFSLAGVASEVGFRSKSTFYNAFKARYDMTPKSYVESLNK